MRMKGYTYQQETARQVGVGAMKNGLTGGGSGGLGDIASLGVGLGAMSGVIGMTTETYIQYSLLLRKLFFLLKMMAIFIRITKRLLHVQIRFNWII